MRLDLWMNTQTYISRKLITCAFYKNKNNTSVSSSGGLTPISKCTEDSTYIILFFTNTNKMSLGLLTQ